MPWLLRLTVLVLLIFFLVNSVDVGAAIVLLSDISWPYLLLLLVVVFTIPALLALRMGLLGNIEPFHLMGMMVEVYFFNNFLPAQLGGDMFKYFALRRYVMNVEERLALILVDRLCGMAALLMLAALGLWIGWSAMPDLDILPVLGGVAMVMVVALVILLFLPLDKLKRLPLFFHKPVQLIIGVRQRITQYTFSLLAGGFLISIGGFFALMLLNFMGMLALNIRADAMVVMTFVPLISFVVMTVPVSINGLGVRESLYVLFLTQAGYSAEEALALALVNLVAVYMVALSGALVAMVRKHGFSLVSQKKKTA